MPDFGWGANGYNLWWILVTTLFFGLCAASFMPACIGDLLLRGVTRAGALASRFAIISLVYGLIRRNAAPDDVTPLDRDWAIEERKADHDL